MPNRNRRAVLRGAAAFIGAGTLGAAVAAPVPARETRVSQDRRDQDSVIAKTNVAIVTTNSGKVAGYIRNGIYTFKGIPYGDTTEGENRFMPPVRPTAWSGVRSCRHFGHVAPQGTRPGWANDEEAFMFDWDDGTQSEDCLRVNVWTLGINDGNKRPVMVWLHGGGFGAGSGNELPSYDGENLSRRGDVVVVTLNHRLNILGFLNLEKYGARYASSGNVGMLDIVAALEWVRDNIAGFGGDPALVTIFGQSGGGAKVSVLMGMPSAKGLFHRAIVESGSMIRAGTAEQSRRLTDLVLREVGLSPETIDQVQTLPFERLLQASQTVLRANIPPLPGGVPDISKMAEQLGFAPIVDGSILPAHPFDPNAAELSEDVPMLIVTTLNEFVTAINHPEFEEMSANELEAHVTAMFGDKARQIIAAFRARTPDAKPFDLWSHIAASKVRAEAIRQAKAKAALRRAPAYLYWFSWKTPILNGRPRAFHCSEIAFVFDNTDRCETMTGGGSDARKLAATMSEAWIQFAHRGNPNHPGMPHWSAFSEAQVPTMIFDNQPQLAFDPDRDEQRSIVDS
jgi:para-nitrobenzyl esterase